MLAIKSLKRLFLTLAVSTCISSVHGQDCQLTISENVRHSDCANVESGEITVSVSGGTPPYYFYWTNGEVTPSIKGLLASDYKVKVSDQNGCKTEKVIQVLNQTEIELDINIQNLSEDLFKVQFELKESQTISTTTLITYELNRELERVDLKGNDVQLKSGKYKLEVYSSSGCYVSKAFVLK